MGSDQQAYDAGGEIDAIYPYKATTTNSELIYSLRSLKNFTNLKRVIICGDVPKQIKGVIGISLPRRNDKQTTTRNNIATALSYEGLSQKVLLMNDDFFIMKKMHEIKPYHCGSLDDFLARYRANYPKSYYTKSISATMQATEFKNSYELHIPFMMDKDIAKEIYGNPRLVGYLSRTIYGNMYYPDAEYMEDVKVLKRNWAKKNEDNTLWWKKTPFISSADDTWRYIVGPYLASKFVAKSPYEK